MSQTRRRGKTNRVMVLYDDKMDKDNLVVATNDQEYIDLIRLGFKTINKKIIGNNLRRIRKFNKWSVQEMADYLNLSKTTYFNIESAKASFTCLTPDKLSDISKKLKISRNQLYLRKNVRRPTLKKGKIKYKNKDLYPFMASIVVDRKPRTVYLLARDVKSVKNIITYTFKEHNVAWLQIKQLHTADRILCTITYEADNTNKILHHTKTEDKVCRLPMR